LEYPEIIPEEYRLSIYVRAKEFAISLNGVFPEVQETQVLHELLLK